MSLSLKAQLLVAQTARADAEIREKELAEEWRGVRIDLDHLKNRVRELLAEIDAVQSR